MEPLLKQLRELPKRFSGLTPAMRAALVVGTALVVMGALAIGLLGDAGKYEYAFTNLTTEDGSEAAAVLKGAGIPFKVEAGGSALSVPQSKVHDARLMLAAAGLPRGGGVGFEIFDRGDLGVSEFTQKVNLRRATEGELARTISRLSPVRSARVHITLPEKGLYRNEDRKAAAAVVLNLQPGRNVDDRELQGIRHLVSAAVAGLSPDSVAVMDGRGTVLAGDRSEGAKMAAEHRELESSMEQRVIDLLEPVVGRGAVIAKVTASIDTREMESTSDAYDPDSATVRSERKVAELSTSDAAGSAGLAGAAANAPLAPAAGASGGGGSRTQTTREDNLKNYEISKTVTRTVTRGPRLQRLSAAVLIAVPAGGKPRPEAELRRLGELAKHAVGFDAERGDRFDISSAPFTPEAMGNVPELPLPIWERPAVKFGAMGGLALLVIVVGLIFALKGGRKRQVAGGLAMLKPGAKVGELEAALKRGELAVAAGAKDLAGKSGLESANVQARARELTEADPNRAAHLLRAWIASDMEMKESGRA
jgi:flagellar M-ring protein FliF